MTGTNEIPEAEIIRRIRPGVGVGMRWHGTGRKVDYHSKKRNLCG